MDLNIRNNDNKLAYDLSLNKEVKKQFEIFMAEKNLFNDKKIQKVPIQSIETKNMQKMFGMYNKNNGITDRRVSRPITEVHTQLKKKNDEGEEKVLFSPENLLTILENL